MTRYTTWHPGSVLGPDSNNWRTTFRLRPTPWSLWPQFHRSLWLHPTPRLLSPPLLVNLRPMRHMGWYKLTGALEAVESGKVEGCRLAGGQRPWCRTKRKGDKPRGPQGGRRKQKITEQMGPYRPKAHEQRGPNVARITIRPLDKSQLTLITG